MPVLLRSTTAAVAMVLMTACGGGDADQGSKIFGEAGQGCSATVLTNDLDDAEQVATGADCFFREFDAGRAVVWDVLVPTVEGDPMPTRYDFDGDTTVITTDTTRDTFGNGGVDVVRCASVRPTNWLPEGVDCVDVGGDGFRSDSLPGDG